jgi:hypothetical protein
MHLQYAEPVDLYALGLNGSLTIMRAESAIRAARGLESGHNP